MAAFSSTSSTRSPITSLKESGHFCADASTTGQRRRSRNKSTTTASVARRMLSRMPALSTGRRSLALPRPTAGPSPIAAQDVRERFVREQEILGIHQVHVCLGEPLFGDRRPRVLDHAECDVDANHATTAPGALRRWKENCAATSSYIKHRVADADARYLDQSPAGIGEAGRALFDVGAGDAGVQRRQLLPRMFRLGPRARRWSTVVFGGHGVGEQERDKPRASERLPPRSVRRLSLAIAIIPLVRSIQSFDKDGRA